MLRKASRRSWSYRRPLDVAGNQRSMGMREAKNMGTVTTFEKNLPQKVPPPAVTICRHLSPHVVTVCRGGPWSRPPHSPSPGAAKRDAAHHGGRAPGRVKRWHGTCTRSVQRSWERGKALQAISETQRLFLQCGTGLDASSSIPCITLPEREHHHWQCGQEGGAHQLAPVRHVSGKKRVQAQRQRAQTVARNKEQYVEELMPGQREAAQPSSQNPRGGEQPQHPHKCLGTGRTVDQGSLFQLSRHGAEKAHQEPGGN